MIAELVDADGDVVVSKPMSYDDGKYDGFSIRSIGPTFVRVGDPVRP